MELLKQRILKDGRVPNGDVLIVNSFINHKVDPVLMREIGKDFAARFAGRGITKVVTIESSGIAPALFTAIELGCELVILKKQAASNLIDGTIQTQVFSFTKNSAYQLTLKRDFISPGEKVLFIDDFLANGEAGLGASELIERCGATVAGIGIVITKAFQPGLEKLRKLGYDVYSLAAIKSMEGGKIVFAEDE